MKNVQHKKVYANPQHSKKKGGKNKFPFSTFYLILKLPFLIDLLKYLSPL